MEAYSLLKEAPVDAVIGGSSAKKVDPDRIYANAYQKLRLDLAEEKDLPNITKIVKLYRDLLQTSFIAITSRERIKQEICKEKKNLSGYDKDWESAPSIFPFENAITMGIAELDAAQFSW